MNPEEIKIDGYDAFDRQRWVEENRKSRNRTPFERDRARIVHSSALRRLSAKTQVLGPVSDDFVRTRLTHTLEVAQVGRELGKAVGCDPDVVDTACLAHDLGHPPFGHNGERALAEVAKDIGGFEGNAQTLRILTRLEPKVFSPQGQAAGLNLTRASLDASIKYPWTLADAPLGGDGKPTHKFGVYPQDLPVFKWLRVNNTTNQKCIEAQVMDLADDISYSVHDVEDAVVSSKVQLDLLENAAERNRVIEAVTNWYSPDISYDELDQAIVGLLEEGLLIRGFDGSLRSLAALKNMTSSLIGRFARAACEATQQYSGPESLTRYKANVIIPRQTLAEIFSLKAMAVTYVMAPREQQPVYRVQREIVAELVDALWQIGQNGLEAHFQSDWIHAQSDEARLRIVIDQVASLTDVSAVKWHEKYVSNGKKIID